jgi:predicted ATPase
VGKTRLARQVAAELIESLEDGVTFVSLAAVADLASVAPSPSHCA